MWKLFRLFSVDRKADRINLHLEGVLFLVVVCYILTIVIDRVRD